MFSNFSSLSLLLSLSIFFFFWSCSVIPSHEAGPHLAASFPTAACTYTHSVLSLACAGLALFGKQAQVNHGNILARLTIWPCPEWHGLPGLSRSHRTHLGIAPDTSDWLKYHVSLQYCQNKHGFAIMLVKTEGLFKLHTYQSCDTVSVSQLLFIQVHCFTTVERLKDIYTLNHIKYVYIEIFLMCLAIQMIFGWCWIWFFSWEILMSQVDSGRNKQSAVFIWEISNIIIRVRFEPKNKQAVHLHITVLSYDRDSVQLVHWGDNVSIDSSISMKLWSWLKD